MITQHPQQVNTVSCAIEGTIRSIQQVNGVQVVAIELLDKSMIQMDARAVPGGIDWLKPRLNRKIHIRQIIREINTGSS